MSQTTPPSPLRPTRGVRTAYVMEMSKCAWGGECENCFAHKTPEKKAPRLVIPRHGISKLLKAFCEVRIFEGSFRPRSLVGPVWRRSVR